MQKLILCATACTLLFLSTPWASPANAEQIELRNGDRLTGEIVDESEDSITLEHATLGRLVIPKDAIKPTPPPPPANPLGDTLTKMGVPAATTHAMQKEEAEQTKAREEAEQKETKAQETKPKEVAPNKQPAVVKEEPLVSTGVFGTRFLRDWNRTFTLGIKGEEGNTVSRDINTSLRLVYEDDWKHWNVNTTFIRETTDRKQSERKFSFLSTRDWQDPDSRWFNYAHTQYDFDTNKFWEHRVNANGGRGYKFIWKDNLRLRGRAGLGGQRMWGTANTFRPEAELGLLFSWIPNPLQKIEGSILFYSDLQDVGDYRTKSKATWSLQLSQDGRFSLRLGVTHDYEATLEDAAPDERHFDITYFGGLGIDF